MTEECLSGKHISLNLFPDSFLTSTAHISTFLIMVWVWTNINNIQVIKKRVEIVKILIMSSADIAKSKESIDEMVKLEKLMVTENL